nr:immunoglobulin light chain junction region [Macaca mulatta]MOX07083.1 immunoglobulin light chain junction region [Macaca mulatta]MOX08346.1 immunoglobulin light chain junction region [Macaca mulatta]MOX08349.1 immunoglobulin light chain junction region [Macaca mulatta]MOX08538.1 immunoglobulin light chain junction region [Macaca mulatta]
CQQHHTYPRTF